MDTMIPPWLPIGIAALSLMASALTLWLTLLRRGRLRMTRPTQLMFTVGGAAKEPQVYFRALLYSTARRGHVVENMFVRLRRGESAQTLSVWVCGEDRLVRGGGIYVGPDGSVLNHHFLHPSDGSTYRFAPGQYSLEVFADVVGRSVAVPLARVNLVLSPEHSATIEKGRSCVFFDWGADSRGYLARCVDEPMSAAEKVVRDLEHVVATVARNDHKPGFRPP